MYVGHLAEPRSPAEITAADGPVTATGFDMDTGRRVQFWASRESLRAYFADEDEDRYIAVEDGDVIRVSGRFGRDLWTNAGLPWSIG